MAPQYPCFHIFHRCCFSPLASRPESRTVGPLLYAGLSKACTVACLLLVPFLPTISPHTLPPRSTISLGTLAGIVENCLEPPPNVIQSPKFLGNVPQKAILRLSLFAHLSSIKTNSPPLVSTRVLSQCIG